MGSESKVPKAITVEQDKLLQGFWAYGQSVVAMEKQGLITHRIALTAIKEFAEAIAPRFASPGAQHGH